MAPFKSWPRDVIHANLMACTSSDSERHPSPGESSSSGDEATSLVSSVNAVYTGSEGEVDMDRTLEGGRSISSDLDETVYMEMTEAPTGVSNMAEEELFEPDDQLSVEQVLAVSALAEGPPV